MSGYTAARKDFDISKDQNAWLHRNNHNGDKAWEVLGIDKDGTFKESSDSKYYISVGCYSRYLEDMDYKEIKDESDDNRWQKFEKICYDKLYDKKRPRYRYSLWRFLYEFKENDILLVPGNQRNFHVYKIISKSVLTKDTINIHDDNEHDFRYFWQVEPIRVNMSRNLLADQALVSRMKIRGTTSELDDNLKNSIIKAMRAEKSILPGMQAMEKAKKALMESLQENLNDIKFEKLIKWYFYKKGADISRVLPKNKSGDQDADVEAVFDTFRIKIYVQAKKHDNKVDLNKSYDQIKKYKEQNDEYGYTCLYWVIYSSLNEQNIDDYDSDEIRIISGSEFAEMLLDAGISDLDSAFFENDNEK